MGWYIISQLFRYVDPGNETDSKSSANQPTLKRPNDIRAVPEIILRVGRRHFFVRWREGVLLTMCPRGGGVEG